MIHAWNARQHGKPSELAQMPNNGPCGCGGPISLLGDFGYWIGNEWQPRCFACYRQSTDYEPNRTEAPEHCSA